MISAEYLAGFFDGEGHIGICYTNNVRRGRPSRCMTMVVVNCNLEVLQEIQKDWGGTISAREHRKQGWSIAYQLKWAAKEQEKVLRTILPFLVIKRREVEFVLNSWYPISYQGKPTKEISAARDAAMLELKKIADSRRGNHSAIIN